MYNHNQSSPENKMVREVLSQISININQPFQVIKNKFINSDHNVTGHFWKIITGIYTKYNFTDVTYCDYCDVFELEYYCC